MDAIIIVAIVFASVGHILMMGVSYKLTYDWVEWRAGSGDAPFFTFLLSLVWPLTLLFGVSFQLGDYLTKRSLSLESILALGKVSRYRQWRQERELQEAHHRLELARVEAATLELKESNAGIGKLL